MHVKRDFVSNYFQSRPKSNKQNGFGHGNVLWKKREKKKHKLYATLNQIHNLLGLDWAFFFVIP